MSRNVAALVLLTALAAWLTASGAWAEEAQVVKLLKPQTDGGRPLMQCLKDRQSSRAFKADKLPDQVLSNLLWAADGVNRPDSGKRTAPSSNNVRNIDIYVSTAEGLYVYDPSEHALKVVLEQDVRPATGTQDFVKTAPLNLVYVADFSKISRGTDEGKSITSAAHCGFISQNVYLFCASEGLATVVRGMVDKQAAAQVMKLRPDQKVMLAQTVGYPQK